MAQKIKLQDGKIVYMSVDPLQAVDFGISGQLTVSNDLVVGNNPLADGTIISEENTNLIISAGAHGNLQLLPGAIDGDIVINGVVWPDGSVQPNLGMFLGASGVNTLQYYPFVIGSSPSDTETEASLNITFPDAIAGQMVLGPNVIYFAIGSGYWRTSAASTGSPSTLLVIKDVTVDYTIISTDCTSQTLLRVFSSSPISITIPDDTTLIPVGSSILIGRNGSSGVTISAASGVTIRTPAGLGILDQYGKITAIKVAANEWEIDGNLTPP